MRRSFAVHAGAALVLSAAQLSAAALTLLPGPSVFGGGKLAVGLSMLALFPVFITALVRGILLQTHGVRLGRNPSLQWLALRCLPRSVQACLLAVFAAGIALVVSSTGDSRQALDPRDGRYYALYTGVPRQEIEISRTEYEALIKIDQRSMFAIPGLLSAGAATLVLVTGQLRVAPGVERA